MHPMLWIAAISVTAANLLGIASMTGAVPHGFGARQASERLHRRPAAVIAPAEPAAPGSEAGNRLPRLSRLSGLQAAAVP